MKETQVQSLGWEDPLEEEMATHSSILAMENSTDRGAWWATVHGVTKSWTRLNSHIQLAGPQFSDQKLNLGHGSECPEP